MFLDLTVNPAACGGKNLVVRVYGSPNNNFIKRLEDVIAVKYITGPIELQNMTFSSLHSALVKVSSWKSLNAYEQTFLNGVKVNTIRKDPSLSFKCHSATASKTMRAIQKRPVAPRLYDCLRLTLPILNMFEQQKIDADCAGVAISCALKCL